MDHLSAHGDEKPAPLYQNDLSDFDADLAILSAEEKFPGVLSEQKMQEYVSDPTSARVPVLRKFLKSVGISCDKSKKAKLIMDIKLYLKNKYR